MIKLADYKELQHWTSLKKTSLNKHDKISEIYMTDLDFPAIDFDAVKERYTGKFKLKQVPKSNDALVQMGETVFFIEFKDGNMKNERFDVVQKIYDSLLIYCDITKQTISDTRSYMVYIIVYNGAASRDYLRKCIDEKRKSDTINEAPSFVDFGTALGGLAKTNADVFGWRGRFGGIYFKDVLTIEKNAFSEEVFKIGKENS